MRRYIISTSASCLFGATLLLGCGATTHRPLAIGVFDVAADEATPLELERSFFIPGEVFTFELSLRGLVGGDATTAVGEPGVVAGRPTIIVKSRVESAGLAAIIKEVRDDVETWIDLDSGYPVQHASDSKFGKKEASVATDFAAGRGGSFDIRYQPKGKGVLHLHQVIPEDVFVFDIHAALGALRAWQPADGQVSSLYVMAGRRIWRNAVRMSGRETIRTSFGRFPTLRFDGVAHRQVGGLVDDARKDPRSFTVWMSDDDNRIPVLVLARTEYGDIRVEMTDYNRPDQRVSWKPGQSR